MVVDGGAGAFEGAVYGFLGGAEHLGDFGGVVAQDVAEDERGALARGQQLQGGDEGQGDGLGGLVAGLRSGALVDEVVEQDVGVGFQPGRGVAGAGGFGQGGLGQRGGDAGASAVGAQHAQAPVGRDLIQPGPERGPLAELAEVTPGGHEGLLECVLGVLQGSQDAVAVHLQLVGVALDQVAERVVVAGPSPGDQVRRVHLHRHASSLFFFPQRAFGSLNDKDAVGLADWAALRRPTRAGGGVYPVGGGPSPGRAPDTRRIKMGKIVVSQNVTLDGVVEDPSGEGGFRHGGWFVQFMGQDWEAWAELELAEAQGAEALLMGRRSDEYFGARSSIMSGEWLDSLNRLPKYVVSATLQEPKWTNATVLAGEVVSEVSKLKQQIQGEIVVYASRPLVRTLMEHDLVDELRLTVFPVAVGAGERLFGETSDKRPLRLIHTKTVGNGLAHLTYERAREA